MSTVNTNIIDNYVLNPWRADKLRTVARRANRANAVMEFLFLATLLSLLAGVVAGLLLYKVHGEQWWVYLPLALPVIVFLALLKAHGLDDFVKSSVDGELSKPEGFGSEIADLFIRILDTVERRRIDLAYEFERKLRHNATRGYRHGGKNI